MGLFDGIHNWKTNLSENEINQLKNEIDFLLKYYNQGPILFILDKSQENRCFIEHVVEKLAKFHLELKNENYQDYELEFWFKNTSEFNKLHCDKDEFAYSKHNTSIHPQLASILYLDDNTNPTYISEIKESDTKFKNFNDKHKCCLSFPKKGFQTTFDGSYFHGAISKYHNNREKRYILLINFWKKYKPNDLIYFNPNMFSKLNPFNKIELQQIETNKKYELVKQTPQNYTTNKNFVFENNSKEIY